MSLVSCSECGKEISRSAASCPGCGAPRKRPVRTTFRWLMYTVYGLIALIVFSCAFSVGTGIQQSSP